jgi:hypothetical protein
VRTAAWSSFLSLVSESNLPSSDSSGLNCLPATSPIQFFLRVAVAGAVSRQALTVNFDCYVCDSWMSQVEAGSLLSRRIKRLEDSWFKSLTCGDFSNVATSCSVK